MRPFAEVNEPAVMPTSDPVEAASGDTAALGQRCPLTPEVAAPVSGLWVPIETTERWNAGNVAPSLARS